MDQIGENIEKIIKAGIGAASTGIEKAGEALEKLAQKGEPVYQQAKTTVVGAAGKLKKAVDDSSLPLIFGCKVNVNVIVSALKLFSKPELDQVRAAIDGMYDAAPDTAAVPDEAEQAADSTQCGGCACQSDDAPAETGCCGQCGDAKAETASADADPAEEATPAEGNVSDDNPAAGTGNGDR